MLRVFVSRDNESERLDDALFRKAKDLAEADRPPRINVYKWSRVWITLKSQSASREVERMQANSKFFRGMIAVSAFTGVSSFVLCVPFTAVGGWVCLLLAFVCFLRYCNLRWKAVEQSYAYFIALRTFASRERRPKNLLVIEDSEEAE
jgi:hypothetical protein